MRARTLSKRALIIGVDWYRSFGNLNACAADAEAVVESLRTNEDGSPNYECKLLVSRDEHDAQVTRPNLRKACQELFDFDGQVILYFSGHGALTETGGFLATSDGEENDYGIPMEELIQMGRDSRASDILIIVDSCHSGDAGNAPVMNRYNGSNNIPTTLRENMTIIAASQRSEVAVEAGGHGVFTAALLDALDGGAADHMGWVTAPTIYGYVERRFGAWDQRPVYKSHSTRLPVIRECAPLIDRLKLRNIINLFPTQDHKYQLDPEFEPEDEEGNMREPINQDKIDIAHLLKEYRDSGLLKPSVPNEQLYWVARRSHSVELTPRGKEYWRLVKNGRI